MRRLAAGIFLMAAVAAAGGAYVLGYTEGLAISGGPLLRFKYPKAWDQPQTFSESKNSGFLILQDMTGLGRRLELPELHLTVVPKETWPDTKAAVAGIAGYRAGEAKLGRLSLKNWTEAVTFDMTFIDPLDRVVGGQVVIGTKVPMRFYVLRAADGRVCKANYAIPASFLARRRAHSLYGRIIRSLELAEARPSSTGR